MPDQGNQLPTAAWRRAAAAIDGVDIGFAVSLALVAAGLVVVWGIGVAMLVTGAIGLVGCIALLVRTDAAERRLER